jgi:hypothetical protein
VEVVAADRESVVDEPESNCGLHGWNWENEYMHFEKTDLIWSWAGLGFACFVGNDTLPPTYNRCFHSRDELVGCLVEGL